jgi:hypothetical protein
VCLANLFQKSPPLFQTSLTHLCEQAYISGMKSRLLLIALLSLTLCSCTKEYNCVCGSDGGEPYVVIISANNLDDAIMECSPPGSDCEIEE